MHRAWFKLRTLNDMDASMERPLLDEDSGLQVGYGKSTSTEPEPPAASLPVVIVSPERRLVEQLFYHIISVWLLKKSLCFFFFFPLSESSVELSPLSPQSISPSINVNGGDQSNKKKKLVWAGEY